jgi:RHS repeat-associated protein
MSCGTDASVDAFGNLSAVNEPDPTTGSSSTGPVTNYTYNGANQLTNVSMTRAGITQTRTFVYNGSDLTSETTPEAGTVSYTYDGNHHVTQRIDALNQKTTYSYDAYERLTLVQHYTWGSGQWNEQAQQDVNYYYDTPLGGGYTQTNTWGRLSAVVFHAQGLAGYPQPDFAYEYTYNQAGRVIGNRMLVTQGSSHLDLQGQYAWDNQGRMTSITYPSGPVMTTQFDAMGRPSTMSETACIVTPGNPQCNNYTWTAGNATYGSAGQLLTVGGSGITGAVTTSVNETRTYNNMLQLTHLVSSAMGYQPPNTYTGGGVDMQYIYNTGHNNGKVAQTIDNTLGETVNYSYDYLHRLTAATSTNGTWGEAYTYDGFGNLTGKTPTQGYAPAMTGSADSNATGGALSGQWDVEKRPMTQGVTQATPFYVYDPWGRRVWRQWYDTTYGTTNCEAYFYGATGKKLESYSCQYTSGSLGATLEGINTYFSGKMLSEKGVFIATDRLGSVRGDSNGVTMSYFPWGEERGQGTTDGRTKFAGYYRDMPGQDYAMARYYSANSGSFWSPDPGGMKTADRTTPLSWNRYAYTTSDPINFRDPSGRDECGADTCVNVSAPDWCSGNQKYYDASCDSDSSGGGGGGEPPPSPGGGGSGEDPPATLQVSNLSKSGAKELSRNNISIEKCFSVHWLQWLTLLRSPLVLLF